jgi:tetratricopeptide (TPR) repeat protein
MWVALGCAVALRMPRSSPPVVSVALKPVSQILLALVAIAALIFYVAAPLRLAMQENIYYTSATDLLEESGGRAAASADYRRRAEEFADEVTAHSLDTAAYGDAAEIFRRLAVRRPAEKTRWLLRAVDVMKKAIELNRDDFALYGDTALLLEKISPDEVQARTEALEMWDKAIERYPNNPTLRVRRADLLDRMGAEAARVAADLEYVRFLLRENRDARGEVVHKSLELEPLPLPGEAESLLAIYHRLCPKYSLSP